MTTSKLQTTTITLAGQEMLGAYDGKDYYVSVKQINSILSPKDYKNPQDFTREKLRSESLKAFTGAVIQPGRKRVGRSFETFMKATDFSKFVGYLASQGNQTAVSLLVALAQEAIERRIDSQLGITRAEEDIDAQTAKFYRELARTSFHPEYTSWNEDRENYGLFVNQLKTKLRLPLVNIDQYTMEQLQRWSKGITAYNALRMEGAGHKYALAAVARQQADLAA